MPLLAISHTVSLYRYHSHVDEVMDTSSGLVGPIIITARGASTSSAELRPLDVSREFVLFLSVINENDSHFLRQSMNFMKPAPANESQVFFHLHRITNPEVDGIELNRRWRSWATRTL